ncbi:MAG: phosphate ABC transporter substrate-binding protein PstS [Ralstonia sp.]|jgi:phosphate transport system substrate-binding protein|uniref:Phosphate-binding protein PstS n=2 Tax=Ralstonia pickettii TaxID=329 RepID=A0A2P4RLB2_RALPI|nr:MULTISPECIES: phosphate ABC transporter substrate-binding protein PstS [Ralstonia]KFL24190.1 phosphate ABC transporter, phosphate-binding protein PstS [Ralstonia pickettii]MBA4199157.1 phosphate ABC transporter substrate-binding protein PstS [Ralstonia sp.]MBA4230202.1 phosphate ABC transporter substrate-binding protein PstS [Ralstonia sp.]MBA4238378.1 phosphate ABC transporter substrate-binding protein PstS [Ralstonia sp.]MBA4282188.1 phosphate ABC transporter substrate-binding protein Pst
MKLVKTAIAGVAALAFAGAAFAVDITGAGATFPAPVYNKWAADYNKATNTKVNYQGIGSSGGIKQITAKTVDFGASDMPLKDEELAKDGLIQFPTVIGGVVPVINLPGVKPGELTLNGQLLGDIYLGKIKKWNDPAIAKLNPKAKLPDQDILVVRRADGSGTSFIFTNYLSKVNAEWKSKVGEGTTVNWPTGTGGKGNEGVAAFVQRLGGAVGYVEYAYAKQNKMTYVNLQNKSGAVVKPTAEAFKAAAAGAEWSKSYYQILTDEPGKDAWPIAGATFILLHKTQAKPEQGAEVMKFFDWAYKGGDDAAKSLDYVPLPDAVKNQIRATWKSSVKDASGKVVYN